jgi:hypothetical protein
MKKKFLWPILMVVIFVGGCIDSKYKFDETKIQYQGHLNFGPAYDIEMAENKLFLSHNKGVEIVDVSNPIEPKKISRIKLKDGAFGIQLSKDVLFVAGDSTGFYIVDIKDLANPEIMSNFNGHKGSYYNVAIKDKRAFVGLWQGKLIILDIEDPLHPKELKCLQVQDGFFTMSIFKDYMYFGTLKGIKVVDIKDIRNPKVIDVGLGTMVAQDMDLQGTILYVSSHNQGLHILDIQDPLKPELIGSFNDGGEANSSYLEGQRLYISDADTSIIEVLDLQNPNKPKKIMEFKNCHAHAVIYRNKLLYMATTSKGLYILKPKPF